MLTMLCCDYVLRKFVCKIQNNSYVNEDKWTFGKLRYLLFPSSIHLASGMQILLFCGGGGSRNVVRINEACLVWPSMLGDHHA